MKLRDILKFQDPALAHLLELAIATIDSIHHFPQLPQTPVIQSRARREQGSYHFRDRPSFPLRIEISKHALHPTLTLIHEVGHLLDTLAFNPLKAGYGSEVNPAFEPLLLRASTTHSIRTILRLVSNRAIRATATERSDLRRYLFPREIWARIYLQWIATRSHPLLYQQFHQVRLQGALFAGHPFSHQWDADAFSAIMPIVDALFREAGLL